MNRLVLIGNGYDLKARLNTSYEDFLVDYFKGMIKMAAENLVMESINSISVNDELIKVNAYFEQLNLDRLNTILEGISTIEGLFKHKMMRFDHLKTKEQWESESGLNTIGEADRFDIIILSDLLKKLLGDYNWRDIESYYFDQLLKIYNAELYVQKRDYLKGEKLDDKIQKIRRDYIVPLNNQFEQLRSQIIEYLSKINTDRLRPFKFIEQLKDPMGDELFKKLFNKGESKNSTKNVIENVKFVNFNYTLSLLGSFDKGSLKKQYSDKDIIYIHGDVDDKERIIFGYGDDTDPVFKELEKTGEDGYLKHLKSFQYPLNKNYLELMDYIHYDQFEVIIAGHSLGISDRVLLKTIFEHDNCKAIRILHRGRQDEEKRIQNRYMALARHFDNKMIMRNKIVPFDISDELH